MIETSIIIPVYNEVNYIEDMLSSLIANDYLKDKLEILVYDGLSTDGTKEILKKYENNFQYINIYENTKRLQVHALNMALKKAQGIYIIRCDAHSIYPDNYISKLVDYLSHSDKLVGNVAGQAVSISGSDSFEGEAVSSALKHPLGVGISHRSIKVDTIKEVDTVLFGAWKKEIFDAVGDFDETFVRGQDYEHNKRLRALGYKVLILPDLEFKYYTRTSIIKLCKMVYQYAYAKTQIIKKYKEFPSIRVLIPAVFVLGLLLLPFIQKLYYIYIIYIIIIAIAAYRSCNNIKTVLIIFIAFPLMHISHGFGFLRGIFEQFVLKRSRIEWKGTR